MGMFDAMVLCVLIVGLAVVFATIAKATDGYSKAFEPLDFDFEEAAERLLAR